MATAATFRNNENVTGRNSGRIFDLFYVGSWRNSCTEWRATNGSKRRKGITRVRGFLGCWGFIFLLLSDLSFIFFFYFNLSSSFS